LDLNWPAKEICQTIRNGYKAIVNRDFAFKVKYFAHKKLHGSVKDHYMKVGRYIQALKLSSPVGRDGNDQMYPYLGQWGDDMKLRFWKIAKAYNSVDYDDALQELEEEFPAAANAFRSYNPEIEHAHARNGTALAYLVAMELLQSFFRHMQPEDYVADWYKKDMYLKAYAYAIPPLEGRPRKSRVKDPFENLKKARKLTKHGIEMTCSACKKKGHNKRRCPNRNTTTIEEPQPKRPKGRPRKDGQPPTTKESSALTTPTTKEEEEAEVGAGPLGEEAEVFHKGLVFMLHQMEQHTQVFQALLVDLGPRLVTDGSMLSMS
ncbi:Translation initiation factor IF-2, partial [Bienertia sinuspersici]